MMFYNIYLVQYKKDKYKHLNSEIRCIIVSNAALCMQKYICSYRNVKIYFHIGAGLSGIPNY